MSAISELGDRALREAKQNKIEGAGVFMSLLDQHPLVKAEVLNEAIVSFAANEMHKAAHRTRTPKKSNYRTLEKTGTDGAVSRMAFNLGDSLMDTWAMACNKPLGDVTVEELIAEAMTEERTAQGNDQHMIPGHR